MTVILVLIWVERGRKGPEGIMFGFYEWMASRHGATTTPSPTTTTHALCVLFLEEGGRREGGGSVGETSWREHFALFIYPLVYFFCYWDG